MFGPGVQFVSPHLHPIGEQPPSKSWPGQGRLAPAITPCGCTRENVCMIPNYAERRRYGEMVSTAFVESTVNQVVAKRFAKKQQMQ